MNGKVIISESLVDPFDERFGQCSGIQIGKFGLRELLNGENKLGVTVSHWTFKNECS